jgi:UPF0716 protein FxsA
LAFIILALVIGIPLVEILVFIEVGSEIGALNTVLITVVTAVIGMALLRVQGLGVIMRAQQAINRKEAPVNEIFEGVFLAVAGLFLLIPGFVTDAIGFLLFLPPLRRALASYMAKHSKFAARANYQGGGRASTRDRGNVIDGEYEVIDDDAPQLNADPDPKDIGGGSKNPESPWADKK